MIWSTFFIVSCMWWEHFQTIFVSTIQPMLTCESLVYLYVMNFIKLSLKEVVIWNGNVSVKSRMDWTLPPTKPLWLHMDVVLLLTYYWWIHIFTSKFCIIMLFSYENIWLAFFIKIYKIWTCLIFTNNRRSRMESK